MMLINATAVCKNPVRSIIPRGKGFTLVITISLLILLVVLAIGLLSLSSITMRNSTRGEALQQAQANARMAMMLALGELQTELGSDRRINCAAAIDSATLPEHGQWIAAYDAWNATDVQRPEASTRFRKYLVSGNRTAVRNRDSAKSAIAGESLEILGKGTLGTAAQEGSVKVGLMEMTNLRGRYAWWISDENAKAKINAGLDVPSTVTEELMALQSTDSAPGTGFRMVEALTDVQVSGRQRWEMGDTLRSKSLSLASADLMPGAIRPLSQNYHGLSTVSRGVLADVRNGRLKRDLSLYLEQAHTPRLQQSLYTVGSSSSVNFSPDANSSSSLGSNSGITMEELWLYYNLYKEVLYNRPATSDDRVGRRPSGFPTLLSGNSREAVMSDRFYPYKRRVYSQVKYMLSLAAAPSAAQPGKFDLRIAVDPVVVLWNPYNVALEYQPGGYTTVGFTGLPYDAVFTTPSGIVTVPFTQFFDYQDVNRIRGLIGRDHAIVLQPGESRVFSRVEGQADSLFSGWRYTEGTLLNHGSFPKGLNRADIVRLTLRPAANGGYLNYITYWFGPRTPNPALQSGTMIMRGDTTLGDLPTISTAQTITVGNVVDDIKIPHMLLSQNMRTETDNKTPSKPWLWSNPSVLYRMAADKSLTARLHHMIDIQVTPVSTWENPHVQITPGNQAYWGGGVRADFGVPFFTFRSVPLVPIKSIASFQHSCANGFRRYWKDSTVSVPASSFPPSANGLDGHRYLAPMGSKLIGNSFAHPLIPANKTHHDIMIADGQANVPTAAPTPAADHAYLANAALWDSWYFSSLTPQTTHPFRSLPRTMQQVFDGFFPVSTSQKPVPLPSARMMPYRASNETVLRTLVKNNAAIADAYRKLSSYLMVDGAFNINSTSVTAWKVLLGSLRDHAGARMDNVSGGLKVRPADVGTTPVSGLLVSNGGISTPTANASEASQWTGYRTLSDYEIDVLATELVKEIKLRGPFLSLSDFVNRRPGSNAELARQGALQAAIEKAGLNEALDKGSRALGNVGGASFPEAGKGSRAAGIPGYISQADILTPLGPVIQARSDTFTIRSYGCSLDANGKIEAQAWCEAVVQRVPDYVHSKDASDVADLSLTSEVNKKFGRKFLIVGFRWLKAEEV